jgi:alcohol dehydrogenase class IV
LGDCGVVSAGFALQLPQRIVFGPGSADSLPEAAAGYGGRILIVTGGNPGRVSTVLDALTAAASEVAMIRVAAEPTLADARRAADAGRGMAADVVVAIGGGSVIDLGKAAAMLLGNGGDPLDYLEVIGRAAPITQPSLPFVAVPTTAGTGSEVTANAVLSSPEDRVKASLRSPLMLPRLAVVDPALTVACPPPVTASSGMDALTQCLEPYVSHRANPVTDGWARIGLLSAGRGLRTAYRSGHDLDARTDMALASVMGGLALANAKLGAVHGFAAALGGMAEVPHGAVCAALLSPVCRANLAVAPGSVAQRYDDIAGWLTGDPEATARDGLRWIEETARLLAVPRLAEYGLTADDTAEVVAKTAAASSMQGNPVPLGPEALAEIYLAAL